jgi:hypothetical protein
MVLIQPIQAQRIRFGAQSGAALPPATWNGFGNPPPANNGLPPTGFVPPPAQAVNIPPAGDLVPLGPTSAPALNPTTALSPAQGPAGSFGPPPNASLQTPSFDPFATQPGTVPPPYSGNPYGYGAPNPNYPTIPPAPPAGGFGGGQLGGPATGGGWSPNSPYLGQPYSGSPYGAGAGSGPNGSFPQQPPYLFQNPFGNGNSNYAGGWTPGSTGTGFWSNFEQGPYLRLFQEVRVAHTWLEGKDGNQVDINDSEISATMNWPDYFGTGEPLRVTPGFGLHVWDGPQQPFIDAELPSHAYSAYVAFDYSSPYESAFGTDLNFVAGVYSDFNALTTNSLRFQGTAVARVRLTTNFTLRLGATYLDRVNVKLLPAVGFFWTPTEAVRYEIFFPYPKIAWRLPQLGNTEVWAYVRAEYGGGSWTIDRSAGFADQVDINDIRFVTGLEWQMLKRTHGFLEIGYVFDRELAYRIDPTDDLQLDDTFMLRAGIGF